MDQASFLALRALGRAPIIQYNWMYERPVDLEALQRFQANLARGFLGRRIERAALPFGRHRWVVAPAPPAIDVADTSCSLDEVGDWLDERVRMPVDPEWGPGFHIGVKPLIGTGAVVSMTVSHSISDGIGLMRSISEAARGAVTDFGFPPADSLSRMQALRRDLRQTLRDLPQVGKAVAATVRVARNRRDDLATSARMVAPKATTRRPDNPTGAFVVPALTVFIDIDRWDERARTLGGSSNALVRRFLRTAGSPARPRGRRRTRYVVVSGQRAHRWRHPCQCADPGNAEGRSRPRHDRPLRDPGGHEEGACRAHRDTVRAAGTASLDPVHPSPPRTAARDGWRWVPVGRSDVPISVTSTPG